MRNSASASEELKKLMADKILKIKICETSRLQLDANVMHPFVKYRWAYLRVHFVDKNTGCYIQNLEKTEDPVLFHKEELTSYNKV